MLIPLGFVCAWGGVADARHGGVPNWLAFLPSRDRLLLWPVRRRPPFACAGKAQLWLERRQCQLLFPLIVGCFVVLVISIGFLLGSGPHARPRILAHIGENLLYLPLLLAPFVGFALCRPGSLTANPYPLSAFVATRPMTTTALVFAKLRMIAWSTFWAWLVVLVTLAFWLDMDRIGRGIGELVA